MKPENIANFTSALVTGFEILHKVKQQKFFFFQSIPQSPVQGFNFEPFIIIIYIFRRNMIKWLFIKVSKQEFEIFLFAFLWDLFQGPIRSGLYACPLSSSVNFFLLKVHFIITRVQYTFPRWSELIKQESSLYRAIIHCSYIICNNWIK